MKICNLFFLLLFIFSSCHGNFVKVVNTKTGENHKPLSREQILDSAAKDHEIYGAVQLSEDTIILIRRSLGFELSTDRGKTWEWKGKDFEINEFTEDDKGIWWGLDVWKGIHEPSYCRMHKSTDGGKSWSDCTFNPLVFFPYHVYSNPHQPLEVTNFWDNKVYKLSGSDPHHHWQYVKQIPKEDEFADISVGDYFVSRENDDNKLYVKGKNGSADTLIHFVKAYNIYFIKKMGNVIYVAGPAEDGDNSYFAVIVNGHILKDYIIQGAGLDITLTPFHQLILTCSTGAYFYKDNRLTHAFK
jgi:hypothetical protein